MEKTMIKYHFLYVVHCRIIMNSIFISALLLISTTTFSQNIKHYKYWNGNYCSNHIYLNDSTGMFYYLEGCEGTVAISKGKFTRKKRKLLLVADTGVSVQLNAIVTSNKGGKSDKIFIKAVDFNETPLRDFRIALLPFPTGTAFMNDMFSTNDSGFVTIDRRKYSHFVYQNVLELASINNKDVPWIEFEKDHQYFTVMLNYPSFCLSYPHITINKKTPAMLKLKENKLRDKTTRITYSLD